MILVVYKNLIETQIEVDRIISLGENVMRKKLTVQLCLAVALLACSTANAAGWGSWGTVNRVEVVRGQGFVVWGSFGNPNTCTNTSGFWVKIDSTQYDELYSMALTALVAGLPLLPYLRDCETLGWHSGTWNVVTGNDAVYVGSG